MCSALAQQGRFSEFEALMKAQKGVKNCLATVLKVLATRGNTRR